MCSFSPIGILSLLPGSVSIPWKSTPPLWMQNNFSTRAWPLVLGPSSSHLTLSGISTPYPALVLVNQAHPVGRFLLPGSGQQQHLPEAFGLPLCACHPSPTPPAHITKHSRDTDVQLSPSRLSPLSQRIEPRITLIGMYATHSDPLTGLGRDSGGSGPVWLSRQLHPPRLELPAPLLCHHR